MAKFAQASHGEDQDQANIERVRYFSVNEKNPFKISKLLTVDLLTVIRALLSLGDPNVNSLTSNILKTYRKKSEQFRCHVTKRPPKELVVWEGQVYEKKDIVKLLSYTFTDSEPLPMPLLTSKLHLFCKKFLAIVQVILCDAVVEEVLRKEMLVVIDECLCVIDSYEEFQAFYNKLKPANKDRLKRQLVDFNFRPVWPKFAEMRDRLDNPER